MNPTLADWLDADDTTRAVFRDWLLERIPPGYRDLREGGHAETVFPRFVHEETGVLFNVIFGGPAVIGMTPHRWARVERAHHDYYAGEDFPAPALPSAEANSPPCEVLIETALVAERPLVFGQLRKLGLDELLLAGSGVEVRHVGALLAKLPRLGWQVPSEAEWEYALRACAGDELGAAGAPDTVLQAAYTPRAPFHLAARELCRDDFMPTLAGYPSSGSRGEGHTTLRGPSDSLWYLVRDEVLWPGRASLASARGIISLRPWVSLRRR